MKIFEHFNLKRELENYDTIYANVSVGVPFRGTNLWILFFAIIIASIGLNLNSTAVIIGAMLISPLMGPIMGLGLSVAINDIDLLKKSFHNYIVAVGIGLLGSTLYFIITPIDEAHSELLARTSPTLYDVLIALFGGLAGIVATSSKLKGNVIPGVAIATALMPPLCTAGYGLATLQWNFFFGALYLFFINTVFIGFSTLLIARLIRFPLKQWQDKAKEIRANRIVWIIVILTVIPSVYFAYDIVQQTRYAEKVDVFIQNEAQFPNDYLLKKEVNANKREVTLTYGGELILQEKIDSVAALLPKYGLSDTKLNIQQGFAYLAENKNNNTDEVNTALNNQMLELQTIKAKYDSVVRIHERTGQMLKELKVQYPQVRSLAFERIVYFTDSTQHQGWLSVIRSANTIANADRNKIEAWIKTRTQEDSVRFIYER